MRLFIQCTGRRGAIVLTMYLCTGRRGAIIWYAGLLECRNDVRLFNMYVLIAVKSQFLLLGFNLIVNVFTNH